MRKMFKTSLRYLGAAAVAACILAPSSAQAKRLMTENFEYQAGGLYLQGQWVHHSKNTADPIQLINMPLTYPGYQDAQTGLGAKLTGPTTNTAQERLQRPFVGGDVTPVTEGSVYMSALVNVQTVPTGDVYFMAMVQRGAKADAAIVDEKSGSEYGRIFVCKGDADGKFKFGMSKIGASALVKTADLDLNTTYLLVVKYEVVDGTTNDIVSLWLNPVQGDVDPTGALTVTSGADCSTSLGLEGFDLRQASTGTKTGSDLIVDAVRIADSYADLWDGGSQGGGEDPTPTPGDAKISLSTNNLEFGNMYQYMSVSKTVRVSGEGLNGPVSVSLPSGFKASATSISAEEAKAGYDLDVTYTASAATSPSNAVMTLSAEGAEDAYVLLTADVIPVKATGFANAFNSLAEYDLNVYYYQGKATVTYIDAPNQTVYAQDVTGAAKFSYAYFEQSPVKVGDQITNLYCAVGEVSFGSVSMLMLSEPKILQQGLTKEPTEVSLAELSRDPETYINRLVKIADVSFAKAGATFSTASTAITSGDASGMVAAFAGSDVIGTVIPESATVCGISTSASAAVVKLRSLADIVSAPQGDPALEMTVKNLIEAAAYQPIGKSVNLAEVTIKYENLPKPAQIYITGTDRAMFSADTEEIPAGSGLMTVTVVYTPTKTGSHKANFMIDAVPTELSVNRSISAKAYDPANLPTITLDTTGLTPFSAKVGETQQQTVKYTVTNGLDYGLIRIVNASGAFQINSSSMMKTGTYSLTVTFAPKSEGSFSDVIEFATDMCEPVRLSVSGSTSGGAAPEERQGDLLTEDVLRKTEGHALLIENFDNCGQQNKPLAAGEWTNAAIQGTRAWWAYTFADDNNTAAKITAYDSRATEESAADMLLLSPALDYKNAAERLLTFRLMGDFLSENPGDVLEVLYIDPTFDKEGAQTPAEVLGSVWTEAIQGLNIPAVADMNKEWVDYVIDLEGQDLADIFFIGFRYRSTRGQNTTTVYYVDDFSWGRGDLPFIRTDLKELAFNAIQNQDSHSETVSVKGLNLTEDIKVSITGQHASKFTPSVETLPAEGGDVHVKFNSPDEGLHFAYLTLKSGNAPATYVPLAVANKVNTGIDNIGADDRRIEGIYTVSGLRVDESNPAPGVYVIRYTDGSASKHIVR